MPQTRDRLFHYTLAVFAILMLLLISINIQLSAMRVAFTTQVYGSKQLWAGHPGALRFTALMGDGLTFEQDLSAEIRLVYEEDGQDFMLFQGNNLLGETLEANFTVPKRVGSAFIIATLSTPDGQEFVKVPITVGREPGKDQLHRLAILDSMAKNKEGARQNVPHLPSGEEIFAYPESGLLAPRAENTIYFFAKPTSPETKVWHLADPLLDLHPDSWGVARFSHNPDIFPTYSIELDDDQNSDANSDAHKLTMEVAPSQMMLKLSSYWSKPGQEIVATLTTLRRQETVFLDVWHGRTLLASQAVTVKNGHGEFRFTLPNDLNGLVFVQIYRPFVNPGETNDGRALYVTANQDEETLWLLINKLAALPGGNDPLLSYLTTAHPETPWHKGAMLPELLLSRLMRPDPGMPLLLDSGPSKIAAFSAQQENTRRQLYRAYVATGILTFLLLVIAAFFHVKATKKAVDTVLDESPELNTEEEMPPRISVMPNKWALILLLLGLAVSLWAIAILLENLRWTIW